MLNMKKYYKNLLSGSESLVEILGGADSILSAYPSEIETFPLVIYEDTAQSDTAYSDNLPEATTCRVRVHIFSKSESGYPTTYAIGQIIHGLFRNEHWGCTLNTETSDTEENVKHRVMDFTRSFYCVEN